MIGTSWPHRLARVMVRPLVGTGVTPNHLTTLRLVTGVLACAALIPGDTYWNWWGGSLWLVCAFLDRADGELARVGNMATPGGHVYDYVVDNAVNAGLFVAIGIGLRHSALGFYAIGLGLVSGASLYMCGYLSEALERLQGRGAKAYSGAFGFDPDDLLYILGPMAWLGWLLPILVGASVGATIMMLLTGWRLRRLRASQQSAAAPA
jgi:archaetidylinositol phosphate synthase